MPPAASGKARIAIYYAPSPTDMLTSLGTAWLGRDPLTGAPTSQPPLNDIEEVTAEPRRYGFHATLKPPMEMAPGRSWIELVAAVRAIAATIAPFELPRLAVNDLRGFLALRETAPCHALQALADACVEQLDPFRAPVSSAELARRRISGLTAGQDTLLTRWGYPYVFDEWFFHMTLTRRLSAQEKAVFLPAAEAHFAPALELGRSVSDVCIFTQSAPGAPFTIAERVPLLGLSS
jgi:putative phosphonate metabolism protein